MCPGKNSKSALQSLKFKQDHVLAIFYTAAVREFQDHIKFE